ncbi:MAG: multiheme c-type cytochrome [Polyangiaceae bacterium]
MLRHLVLAVVVCGAGLAACEGCRSTGNTGTTTAPTAAGQSGPPTVRLYLVTDLAGALEPCGCTRDQLGGLDHFGAWVKHEQAHAPAALVASAGPLFFMDDKLEGDRADQDRIKAQTIAQVLHGLGFAAFAPGTNDWDDGREGLLKLSQASGAALVLGAGGAVVREAGGVKVGFVGYGQTPGRPGQPEQEGRDVEAAVRKGVDEAKKQGAEVLVALAAVGRGEAKRIADAVPELTAVVVGSARSAGDSNTTAPQGEQVGDVLVVQASNHLQTVAVLDLYVREPLVPGHVVRFADATGLELSQRREELARRIDELHVKIAGWERDPKVAPADVAARKQELASLEAQREGLDTRPPPAHGSFFRYSLKEMRESLGKDPGIEAAMSTFYKAVDDHNRVAFADRVPPPVGPDQAGYVGIEVCSTCHPGPREVWNGTPHAHAYTALSSQFKEFNLECVDCHVTGYEKPGGSTVTHADKLKDVQCEVCHGPGSRHVQNPTDRTRIVAHPDPSRCLDCHHPPHVEGFDPAVKMKEILGPGHGLPR